MIGDTLLNLPARRFAFHNFTPADVVVAGDPAATLRAILKLQREQRAENKLLRLILQPSDLDENDRVKYSMALVACGSVVVVQEPTGWRIKKHSVHRDDALVGLPV